jgi:hypothetical protein
VPVPNEFLAANIQVPCALVREEHDGESQKKHHVSGKNKKDNQPDALEQLTRTAAAQTFPFVVVATTAASGGSPVNRGFAADAGIFSLGLYRISRKSAWHGCAPQ